MASQTPFHTVNVYGSFGFRLDKEAVEFRQRITKKIVVPPQQWDLVKEGLDLFAVRTDRKCVEMERKQLKMKQEVREQKKLNEFRLEEVREILQKDIHQKFIEINSFVRDCSEKEKRATEKLKEDEEKQVEIKRKIGILEEDLQKLFDFKCKIEECVKEFSCFEDAVMQLVLDSEQLSSSKDFMDKCDALMLAQVEISEMEMQKIKEIEEFQRQILKIESESETEFLGLNNFIVDLDKAYEKAHAQGIEWERVLVQSRDVIVNEEDKYTRIVDSARQLYLLLCKRNGKEPHLQYVSLEDQLDFIKDETEILATVLEKATEFLATEEKSLHGEWGTGEI